MAVFSTNQNRQLYVANSYSASVTEASATGAIGGVKVADGELYFLYKGAENVLKSDRIQLKNLDYAKAVDAADMVTPLKKVKAVLDSAVNGGNPVTGQDYILRIVLRQFYGMSDQDQYFKEGIVHATSAMAADKKEFYKAMVKSLNQCFSREVGASATSNPYLEFNAGTAGSEDGIYIIEKPQEWALGTESQERVYFDAFPTTIYTGGDDVIWGTVTDETPAKSAAVVGTNAIGNGKKIADLEWFCMGERGDQYRFQGWPNYIPTTYLVNPAQQYHVLEFHFAFTDTGVNSYRSEKDITIVSSDKTVINDLIAAINSEANLNIATL